MKPKVLFVRFAKLSVAIIAVCLLIVCIVCIVKQMDAPRGRENGQTQKLICCVLDKFDELQGITELKNEPQRIVSVLETQSDSLSINKALVTLLNTNSYTSFRSLAGFNLSNGVFRDGWGTPLLFALTNSVTNSGLIPLLTHRPFVVWSAGPNLINEYGSGDDVVVTGR
jgi:hypothetical protein